MKIAVLGLGFVGLTTALGFARKGFRVVGFDIDTNKTKKLLQLEIPFDEPHLDAVLQAETGKNFSVADSLPLAIRGSDVVFICVGTPSTPDGDADCSFLLDAVNSTLDATDGRLKTIIIKSTVPPATADEKILPVIESRRVTVGLASNPEFLRQGFSWDDFMNPDRIVVGCEDEETQKIMSEIYAPFAAPVYFVSRKTAEFIKYLSNTMLSTMISYANEMSIIADKIGGIDVTRAFKILHQDKRWSGTPANMASYIYPGCGYGGYCLPKDTAALLYLATARGYRAPILEANLKTNDSMPDFVVSKIASVADAHAVIGILGLAFKKGSNDVRHSPAAPIISKLLDRGYKNIAAYDPETNELFAQSYSFPIAYENDLSTLVRRADHLLLLTAWDEFKHNESLLKSKVLHDFRYIF